MAQLDTQSFVTSWWVAPLQTAPEPFNAAGKRLVTVLYVGLAIPPCLREDCQLGARVNTPRSGGTARSLYLTERHAQRTCHLL